jgi:hypothetical protein
MNNQRDLKVILKPYKKEEKHLIFMIFK